jgi:L-alanine-DL-glutamate epimerase-like enolase superfamily enzyme
VDIFEVRAMKITNIETREFSWPREKPIRNGKHVFTHVNTSFVLVHTDEGVTGVGVGRSGGPIWRESIRYLEAVVMGHDPIEVERLWHLMWVPKTLGRRGVTTRAISSLDMAFWDIRAQVANMPLYKLLGAYRKAVPAYIAGGYYEEGKGLDDLAREMSDNVAKGAGAVKMKIGAASLAEDVERVRVVREAIGRDVKLLVDANCAYTWHEAAKIARMIEPYDIFWFEEPVAPDDYSGHAKVARSTIIPIATGENEYTRYGFRDLMAHDAASIFNADAKVMGGVSEFMKVAAMAQPMDIKIAPHGAQEVHIHLVAAIENGLILEFYDDSFDPMWGQIYDETLQLGKDGCVEAAGIKPRFDALKNYRIA